MSIVKSITAVSFAAVLAVQANASIDVVIDDTHNVTPPVNIVQLAKHDSVLASAGVPDKKSPLGWSGNLDFQFDHNPMHPHVSIFVDPGLSLEQVVENINQQSNNMVTAAILNSGDDFNFDYRLWLKAANTGSPLVINNMVTTNGEAGVIPASSGKTVAALSAQFTFEGVTFHKPSNRVSDLISGVTLVLR